MSEAAAPVGISRLLSDERLTRRAIGGDERAFAAIFRRYHQSLYRYCLAILGNPEDAQDALQNTMAKVLRALPGEERRVELKPWLYRIAHNEAIDLLRRRRETAPLDAAEQAVPGPGLAEDVATRERLQQLLADLRELPERQREVLVMREMSGLRFEEIGAALETSAAVARQTLYEARQSLRQMEEGREMDCDAVSRALSDGDGRVARRRDVRAHLRSCAACREFRDEIRRREGDFAALAPLPALAGAAMLQGLVGGAAKTIATSAAVKGVATVAVVAAVGVTAADRSGVVHLGLPGERSTKSAPAAPIESGGALHGTGGSGDTRSSGRAGKAAVKPADKPAAVKVHGAASAPAAAAEASPTTHAAPAGAEHGQGAAHANPHSELKSQNAESEHPGGAEHEKQQPEAAADGQQTADENKSKAHEPQGEAKAKGSEKEAGEAPENPPKGASASPAPQAPETKTPTEPPGHVDNPGKGRGWEKDD